MSYRYKEESTLLWEDTKSDIRNDLAKVVRRALNEALAVADQHHNGSLNEGVAQSFGLSASDSWGYFELAFTRLKAQRTIDASHQ